jgi:hypothetical protein
MNDTTLLSTLSLPQQALLFDLEALYACLQTIPDHRDRRGRQYPLASLLMIGVLAKLAGQDSSRGMPHWAKLRTHELSQLFHLKQKHMPHYSIWSRVLGHAVEPAEVEHVIGQFFITAAMGSEPKRGSLQLALDGKTLRGTIPLGATQGVHLLAAYLPKQGVVLAQIRVDEKSNEITHAPKLLTQVDLRGVLGAAFALLGVVSLYSLTLPAVVTAFAGIQAFWWLAAAITLIVRTEKTSDTASVKAQEPAGSAL